MDDDVEVLAVIMGLDVPLEVRRGVAPAGRVLEVRSCCTRPDGAEEARGRAAGGGAGEAMRPPSHRDGRAFG